MARIFITGSTDGLGRAAARALINEAMRSFCTRDLASEPRRSTTLRHTRLACSSVILVALLKPEA